MKEFNRSPNGKYTKSEWKALIENFNPDIETKTQYCLKHNITRSRFTYWNNKILNKRLNSKKIVSDFKEVALISSDDSQLQKCTKEFISITYPNGIKVDVPARIDSLKLAQLIVNIQKVI